MAKMRCCCTCTKFSLKPETNLALVLCLVFYLYICLGGALFLLLEGQSESDQRTGFDNTTLKLVSHQFLIALFLSGICVHLSRITHSDLRMWF